MSLEKFEDDCEDCRPILVNPKTGALLAPGSPEMVAVLGVWAKTTLPEREAWHRMTCQGSQDPADVDLVGQFISDMQEALQHLNATS